MRGMSTRGPAPSSGVFGSSASSRGASTRAGSCSPSSALEAPRPPPRPSVQRRRAVPGAEDLVAGGLGVEVVAHAQPRREELGAEPRVARGDVRAVLLALEADAVALDGA